MIPLPAERTQRSLLGLLSTGVVEFAARAPSPKAGAGRRPRGDRAEAERAAPAPPAPAPPRRLRPRRAPPAAPPPAAAAAPRAEPADEKAAERRREILEAWDGLKTRTHFEVLGLSRSVGEAEVKDAYFRLAKRFHPDVHHGASLGDLRDKLEAVFIRLGEAYDVLRDPRKRADYEERLGRPRPKPAARGRGGRPGGARSPHRPSPRATRRRRPASPRRPSAGRPSSSSRRSTGTPSSCWSRRSRPCRASRACAPACCSPAATSKNPKWAKSAEAMLLAATREEPKAVEPWALLGAIYAEKGLRTRATAMYRKALELKPDHEEAAQYLAQNAPPPEPPEDEGGGEGGGGLLGRLFRKG